MEIFNFPADSKDLELALAAFVDGGNHFVSATYYLEGDGPLVFSCYERLATVSNAVAVAAYPNVEGVARRQAGVSFQAGRRTPDATSGCLTCNARQFTHEIIIFLSVKIVFFFSFIN